jgi:hypothetical protein
LRVEYARLSFRGKEGQEEKETDSIERFLHDEILYKDAYRSDREKIRLEEQPKAVVEAMARLINILLEKGVLDLENLKEISGCTWGRKADSLKLLKEGEET